MRQYLASEIKAAMGWAGAVVFWLTLWLIRWVMRMVMLLILLSVLGGGCFGIIRALGRKNTVGTNSHIPGFTEAATSGVSGTGSVEPDVRGNGGTAGAVATRMKAGEDLLNRLSRDFSRFIRRG